MNNDVSLQEGEEAQFGEYAATKSSNGNLNSSLDGIQIESNTNAGYETTTKEISMDPEYGQTDILKLTSEGIGNGIENQFSPSYDVLEATSEAQDKGAYGLITKVNEKNSTHFVDDNLSTGAVFNINDAQTNDTMNTQFEAFYETGDKGRVQFGEYLSTKGGKKSDYNLQVLPSETGDGNTFTESPQLNAGSDLNVYQSSDSIVNQTSALN